MTKWRAGHQDFCSGSCRGSGHHDGAAVNPSTEQREAVLARPVVRAALIACAYLLVAGCLWLLPTRSRMPPQAECLAMEGQAVWRDNTCASCHALFGLGGQTGPDLTNVLRARGTNTVREVIRRGRGDMPGHGLADEDLDRLMAYLAFVESTGEYPLRTRPLAVFGRAP